MRANVSFVHIHQNHRWVLALEAQRAIQPRSQVIWLVLIRGSLEALKPSELTDLVRPAS